MLRNLKKNQSGFTIIEVLIVLAIAGLILGVVLATVPSLKRSQRNTQRKADVSAVLGAIADYTSNNNGAIPTTLTSNAGGIATFGAGVASDAKVNYYTIGNTAVAGGISYSATLIAANTLDTAAEDYLAIISGATCSGTGAVAGSARSVAAVYEIENTGSTYAQVCLAS